MLSGKLYCLFHCAWMTKGASSAFAWNDKNWWAFCKMKVSCYSCYCYSLFLCASLFLCNQQLKVSESGTMRWILHSQVFCCQLWHVGCSSNSQTSGWQSPKTEQHQKAFRHTACEIIWIPGGLWSALAKSFFLLPTVGRNFILRVSWDDANGRFKMLVMEGIAAPVIHDNREMAGTNLFHNILHRRSGEKSRASNPDAIRLAHAWLKRL